MRALCCMTAATMLAAGVSARADLVRTFNVSGTFPYSIRVSDPVVVDAMTSAPEFASALSWPMDATEQGYPGSSLSVDCSIVDSCGSAGTYDANASSALALQAGSVTRGAEPSSVALLGTALLGFAAMMRRRFPG
jgi:hypothetical protein